MKLTLQLYGINYIIEEDHDDFTSSDLKGKFSRLLVAAGFPPEVIESDDGGHYEYVSETEIVVEKSYLEELSEGSKDET